MKLFVPLSAIAAAVAVAAQATPPTLYTFGDALSSLGTASQLAPVLALPPPFGLGQIPSAPAWSEFLAPLLGYNLTTAVASSAARSLSPLAIPSSQDQINFFRAIQPFFAQAASHSNDIAVLETGFDDLLVNVLGAASGAASPDTSIATLVATTIGQLEQLRKIGFRNFIIPDMIDIQSTPLAQLLPAAAAAGSTVAQYNKALPQQVAAWASNATGLGTVALLPLGEFVNTVLQSPPLWQALGLTDVQAACIAGNAANLALAPITPDVVVQLVASLFAGTVCDNPSTHLFLDGIHLAERVQRLLGHFVQSLLNAARNGQSFEPTVANLLGLISTFNLGAPAPNPTQRQSPHLKPKQAAIANTSWVTQSSSSSSSLSVGYTCETVQDGSRLLKLGEYSVSFTNAHGAEQKAAGFQPARAMVKTVVKAEVKAEAKAEPVEEVKPEAPAMMLDETQERISKMGIEKPLLIVAGAGSGKTSTLCARVVEMIRHGVEPARILVITFTNKAADELKARIVKYMRASGLLPADDGRPVAQGRLPHASTFHSWCFRLLMAHYERLGWKACPLVAAVEAEHMKIMGLAVDQIEDCRRLVQCEQMLDIPVSGGDAAPVDKEQSIYVDDAEPRWQRVLEAATERTGFTADHLQPAVVVAAARGPAKRARVAVKAEKTQAQLSVTRVLYEHLYARIGRARGLVDLVANKLAFEKEFPGKDPRREMMNFVYRAKSRGDGPELYPQLERSVLAAYNGTLRRFGLVDFDDLLKSAEQLLDDERILATVRGEYPYLLVDEFQDFNQLQTRLVLRMQTGIGRVTAVGDERQSIYAFRGAACESNFRLFLETFVDATVRRTKAEDEEEDGAGDVTEGGGKGSMECLTRNYRSHQSIVDLGNIVARDTIGGSELLTRLRVPLQAQESAPVVPVAVWHATDVANEGELVAERIRGLVNSGTCPASEIAVLSRCLQFGTYRPTGQIEAALLRRGIPFVVRGGHSALKSRRMQLLMALVRVVANSDDDIAFEACMVELAVDVGPATANIIRALGNDKIASLALAEKAERAAALPTLLPRDARAGLRAFLDILQDLRARIGKVPLRDFIRSMFAEHIEPVADDDAPAPQPSAAPEDGEPNDLVLDLALAVVDSLFMSPDVLPAHLVEAAADPDAPCSLELLCAFSSQLCLLSTAAEDAGRVRKPAKKDAKAAASDAGPPAGAVVITTVHQAKGLEWEHVFVPHFNECLFPMGYRGATTADRARARMDPRLQAELARGEAAHFCEEGRLAYVAITRAKVGLYITVLNQYPMAWMKRLFGSDCTSSRYLPNVMYGAPKPDPRAYMSYSDSDDSESWRYGGYGRGNRYGRRAYR
ncbi:hypothetical protein IWQ57_001451 [Coemansia nantahalensis]|uniref:Uncharacterized protein n=1 Tax=Coemansia nantahalensis TaxID=2789366 RepID=A0ACC1K3Z4_9FUNG|nr:hypothetical protein IWQ57_001451 [Coemansia nantahalensis]